MEDIIAKLLVPNSKTIQQGTKELKEAYKKPEAIPALCDVLVTSKNVEIRQTAAVLLRRRLGKKHQWNKVNAEIRNRIKQGMLQALINEQEVTVKNGIAQFIGILGKHEFPNNTWPEILQFIYTVCNSDNETDKELGMYTLSIMTEISKDSYIVHAQSFAELFTKILTSHNNPTSNLSYYTVLTMLHLVPVIGGHQQMINIYHQLYPKIMEIINAFSTKDERKACDLFEIIEELIEYAISVVVPHINMTVEMCLQIGANKNGATSVQIKAIAVLGWLIRSKAKLIQKHKLIEPIIDVMIKVMALKPDDESEVNEDYYQGDPDEYTSTTIASQTLDLIALHVPPDKVIPFVLTRIEPAIQGTDVYAQKAAYLALAVLAEGCSEYIRKKYLEPFLKCVCNGITNDNVIVRNAALFALGQFAEHLQPEISKYASELLPVLFQYLSQIYAHMENDKTEPPSLNRMFYALETFCENLDEGLLPYLPTLMERMLTALNPNHWSMQLKKTAFETVSAAASAAKEGMLPYFPKLLEIINVYMSVDADNDNYHLRSEALECLATLAQSIGNENFKPLAPETMKLGLQILEKSDDPDTRRSVYMLFASLAGVMKEDLTPVLPQVVDQMISTIQSSEGIETHYGDDDKDGADIYDDLSDSDDELDEDIEISSDNDSDSSQCKYSVENAYIDEKEQACITLREICRNVGTPFLPYLEKSFEEIFKLINFPQNEIRKSSIEALQQFCIALHETKTEEGRQACLKALQMLIPKCSEIIRSDEERNVVMCALDTFAELLENIKGDVLLGDGHREAIMNCVIDVLTLKTACQDSDLGGGIEEEEEGEAEQDELLIEYAGDVIPKFGNAIQPDDFQCYFPNILQLIGSRTKKQYSESQRSFSYGTLAECMKPLGVYIEKFISQLIPLWFNGAKDKSDEVRNNSIYGLGEMVLYGKDCVFPHYTQILQALSGAISNESHAGTMDNICGALAKLIITNSSLVPLEQVLPVLLERLPLKEDYQENDAIVKCFHILYQQGNALLQQNLATVIKIIVHIYCNPTSVPNEETNNLIIDFLKVVHRDFNDEFSKTVTSLGPEVTNRLKQLFS